MLFKVWRLKLLLLLFANPCIAQKTNINDHDYLISIRPLDKLALENPQLAINELQRALDSKHPGAFGTGMTYLLLGNAHLSKNEITTAIESYKKAAVFFSRHKEGVKHLSDVYNNIGLCYARYEQNNYIALEYFYKGIDAAAKYGNQNFGPLYTNISGIFLDFDQFSPKAVYYLNKAQKWFAEHRDTALLTAIYNNKGSYFLQKPDWDSALYYYRKSCKIAREKSLEEIEFLALLNIGTVQFRMQNFDSAFYYYKSAEKIDKYINPHYRSILELSLGDIYLQQNNYELAEKYLLSSLKETTNSGHIHTSNKVHQSLANLYKRKGMLSKALYHFEQHISEKDSLNNEHVRSKTEQLETMYRTSEKDKELAHKATDILRHESELKKQAYLIVVLVCIILIIGIILNYLVSINKHKRRQQELKITHIKQDQEINLLKAKINGEEEERKRIAGELHDGLSSLTSILSLNFQQLDQESASDDQRIVYGNIAETIQEMNSEIRKTVYNLTPDFILRYSLPEAVRIYCEKMSLHKKVSTSVQAIGEFEKISHQLSLIIYRILQELIHNAVKHAKATNILVQIVLHKDVISITVEDDGIGFDTENVRYGLGLQNIRQRLNSLNGNISIDSTDSGTSINIEIYT